MLLLLDCCLLPLLGPTQAVTQGLDNLFLSRHLAGTVDSCYALDTVIRENRNCVTLCTGLVWQLTVYSVGAAVLRPPVGIARMC